MRVKKEELKQSSAMDGKRRGKRIVRGKREEMET